MKSYNINGIEIVGIDHGYGNMKSENTILKTGVTAYDSMPMFMGNVLEYNGMYYKIGENHKEFKANKIQDKDYFVLTLASVANELMLRGIDKADVWLAAGVPLKWVRNQRDSFKSYLTSEKSVSFKWNDKTYQINIVGCDIWPQGFAAIAEKLHEMPGVHMIADIGNGTMNTMIIADGKPNEEKCWTDKIGTELCMLDINNAILDKFGTVVDSSVIEHVIRSGSADIGKSYLDLMTSQAEAYVKTIFRKLREYGYNSDLMKLHIIGGGGAMVKNFGTGQYDEKRTFINPDLSATAKGYAFLSAAKMKRGR